jgi:hypothetical protein
MDIVRFTARASTEARAGITGGDRVVELGAGSVAELLAEPAAALQRRCEGASGSRYPLADGTLLAPVDGRTEM